MNLLQNLMQEQLPEGGIAVPGACDLHIEVMDTTTGLVWMSFEVATQEDFDALVPNLDESLRPIGIGSASMDAALFQYSPGGEGEHVRERTIGGQRYFNVAAPGETTPLPGGMVQIMVSKAHVVGYEAGRLVTILSMPDGDFVEVVGTADKDDQIPLPEGATLKTLELQEPWVVPLPNPTTTLWHFGAGMRSFQGPVTLPGEL